MLVIPDKIMANVAIYQYLLILYITSLCFLSINAKGSNRDPRKKHPIAKNEVTGLQNLHQVCMDVCNPPYYSQEYPASNLWNPFGGYNEQYYPQYENVGYNEDYYPQNQFGELYPECYRNMFRKTFDFDPGNRKPKVLNYRKLQRRKLRNHRKRNFYRNYQNCQLICYPLLGPNAVQVPSVTKPPVTTSKKTTTAPTETTSKKTTTEPSTSKTSNTESTESTESSEVPEATVLPPEKPENTTDVNTTAKPEKRRHANIVLNEVNIYCYISL
ncbi:hypothetical protein HHI36_021273 [Cryptolaemus montrouzieri]|uniref:Uncharacterized protein n=1 Tax=Cryptolaemus montrouzieri TaxID=559131 RepID=A0ABD2MW95_9CUCU